MMAQHNEIFVPLEEEAGVFYAPVTVRPLQDGTYEILDNDGIFEMGEPSQLFAFGPGDVVEISEQRIGTGQDVRICPSRLVRSGTEENDFKRLLFQILEMDPKVEAVVVGHSRAVLRRLVSERKMGRLPYPGIAEWVDRNLAKLKEVE